MSRIIRTAPGLGRGGLIGNTEGPEAYLRALDTLPSQFCRATGGTETVIEEGDAAVSLLLNFDGSNGSTTFTDQSIYAHTVTANGNAQISTTQSKFGGSSLYLDGTGDYLTVPVNAPTQFGTGDFTLEAWCRFDALAGVIADELPTGATASGWQLYYRPTGSSIAFYANSSVILQDPSSVRVTTNTWYHIAVTRSGSTARLFIDGEEVASATLTTDLDNGRGVVVGSPQPDRGITNAFFPGYIDSLRITKGQALYTSNFTPPASAPTNKTGKYYRVHTFTDTDPTSLLLNFDGSNGSTTFTDDSGWGHAVTANGDAQISTAQSVFGGSSAYFDGTGDYLSVAANSAFAFGTGDFTVEFWLQIVSSALQQTVDQWANSVGSYLTGQWMTRIQSDGTVSFFVATGASTNQNFASSTALATGTFYHLAIVRSSGVIKMYIDGAEDASTLSHSGQVGLAGSPLSLGIQSNSSTNLLNGYIDSLRITKGQALYTAAFTPSTTALTRVGSGSLTFTRGGAVEYLVVGGGGGGGSVVTSSGRAAGGGGAGGFRSGVFVSAANNCLVSVGGGGSGGSDSAGANGGASSLSIFESAGGGGGGGGGANTLQGLDGGSGGGGYSLDSPGKDGGSGNTPTVSPSQGNDGGLGISSGGNGGGGGGGGASAVGADAVISPSSAGDGGDGTASTISGSSVTYAGGGGGGSGASTGEGSGGSGGGGTGGNTSSKNGTSGTANTGSGGGGASSLSNVYGTGGAGGSGIVIARYRITQAEYEAEAA